MIPLVSVIVPVYNLEPYIGRCIESIQKQTFEQWELICVDDGSSDASGQIMQTYADTDTRIKVIRQENSGISVARNRGLQVVKGAYIMFVDGDDMLLPDAVEKMLDAITKDQSDIVVCGYWDCDESGKKERHQLPVRTRIIHEGRYEVKAIHVALGIPFAWGKLYRADIIRRHRLKYNSEVRYIEDSLFNFQYFQCSKIISYIEEALYLYCHRNGSCLYEVSQGQCGVVRYRRMLDDSLHVYSFVQSGNAVYNKAEWSALALYRVFIVCKVVWQAMARQFMLRRLHMLMHIITVLMRAGMQTSIIEFVKIFYQSRKLKK